MGTQSYGPLARTFHWAVVVLIIGLLLTNEWRGDTPRGSELKAYWLSWHMALGISLFVLSCLRLGWRFISSPPPVSAPSAGWRKGALFGHGLLYAFTLLVPIFGYLRIATKGKPIALFDATLPAFAQANEPLHELMELLHGEPMELLLYLLVAGHVAFALYHQFVLKDGTLGKMRPW